MPKRETERSKDWSFKDDEDSLAQGWSIFMTDGDVERSAAIVDGKPYGDRPFELCKYDEEDTFKDDAEAWEFVWNRAREGDRLAKRALRFLQRHSIREYRAIERHMTKI